MSLRIGNGYDVHRLTSWRRLILGGVTIPFDTGLLGHSDADVLVHAIIDALLGAMGLPDIGQQFPDTDDKYKDASSIELLVRVKEILDENGYAVSNIDSIVVAQKPKLATYIGSMRENIADALGIQHSMVNIKATTEEGLGFTGQGEGISAYAVCLISAK